VDLLISDTRFQLNGWVKAKYRSSSCNS